MSERKKEDRPVRREKARAARASDEARAADPVRAGGAAKKAKPAPKAAPEAPWSSPTTLAIAAGALAIGAAAGWFARGANSAAATVQPDPAAAASSSAGPVASGPCGDWVRDICGKAGEESEGCGQAKAASELLPAAACVAARADVAATLAKLEAARASCTALADKLCNDLGKETKTCGMVKDKIPTFPAERCKGMLAEYDGVLGELKQMEKAEAPLSADLAARHAAGDAPGFGPSGAKVTVVAYSDFECPFCARSADVVVKLKEKYGNSVRFVFRQFPLSMHENAPLAAEAALAAHAQGKFWPFHDLLFENQRSLERPALEQYAQKAGLDMAKFKKALDDHTYAANVKSDMKLGEEAGVSGTPSMFIGTERVSNPTSFEEVAREIDKKLAN